MAPKACGSEDPEWDERVRGEAGFDCDEREE